MTPTVVRSTASRLAPLAAITVLLSAACSSSPAAPTPEPSGGGRVAVLGDSLAVSPSPGEGFPAQLQALADVERLPWTVTNAGVAGDTTADGLRRVDAVLDDDVDVLVLALGANDGLRGVDVAAVEANLAAIIERSQARGVRVLLCGMETPPTYGLSYSLAFHDVFPRLSSRHGVPLVPFLLSGVVLVPEMNGPDGIHPNAAGARKIANTIWPYLKPMLTAPRAARASIGPALAERGIRVATNTSRRACARW